MVNSDPALYNLRYNQLTNELEGFGGGVYIPIPLTNVDPTQVPVTRLINTTSPLVGGGNLSADRTLSMPAATSLVDGYLLHTDWATFNSKQAAGSYITALTGDVTASGPGSSVATIASAAVTAAKLASGAAVTNIGYTPVNKAGDTLTGGLTISPGSGLSFIQLTSGAGHYGQIEVNNDSLGSISVRSNTNGVVQLINTLNSFAIDGLGNALLGGTPGTNNLSVVADLITSYVSPGILGLSGNQTLFPNNSGETFFCDASGGVMTVTLPDLTLVTPYRFTFKKVDSSANAVTIAAHAGQTIDAAATYVLSAQYNSVTIVGGATATSWGIIAKI